MAGCIPACQPGIGIPPHPSSNYYFTSWGGGPIHSTFATLNYVAGLEEVVVADSTLFRSDQHFQQRAAQDVVAALMVADQKAACLENPRVLGPEGGGGVEQFPLRGTSNISLTRGAA